MRRGTVAERAAAQIIFNALKRTDSGAILRDAKRQAQECGRLKNTKKMRLSTGESHSVPEINNRLIPSNKTFWEALW
jgi:hypothetical protein